MGHRTVVEGQQESDSGLVIACYTSSWNVMARGDAREGKLKERNWRMQWVAITLHTTSEHGVSSITTADAHTPRLRSSRLNWRQRADLNGLARFARKTKSGFCARAIIFQTQSTWFDSQYNLGLLFYVQKKRAQKKWQLA